LTLNKPLKERALTPPASTTALDADSLLAALEALAEGGAPLSREQSARLLSAAARLYGGPQRLVWARKGLPPPPPPLRMRGALWSPEGSGSGSAGGDEWRNLLIECDNLLALSTLTAPPWRARLQAAGGVKLLYIDPPFNVGADFSQRAQVGAREVETLAYRDAWGEGEESLAHALYARLSAALPLLAPDASVYVHIDDRMSATARLILDELLGARRFRNEVVWWYKDPSGRVSDRFKRKHDTLLFYALSAQSFFDVDAVRVPYSEGTLAQARRGTKSFGRAVQVNPLGKLREDVWEVPILNSQARERVGYPTQKPEALLEVVLRASSRPGDLVLDLFCGSGTTLAVAERLGRRWVGVDSGPLAVETARRRLCAQGARPFLHLEAGGGERLWALGATPTARYHALALEAWGALPAPLRGLQRLLVVPVGEALTPEYARGPLREAIAGALEAGASGVDVIAAALEGWAWGEEPWAPLREAERAAGGGLTRVWLTSRDALDPRALPARLDLMEPLLPCVAWEGEGAEGGRALRLRALEPPCAPPPADLAPAAPPTARPLRLVRVGGALLGVTRGGLCRLTTPEEEADLLEVWLEAWAASWGEGWRPLARSGGLCVSADDVKRPTEPPPHLRLSYRLGAPIECPAPLTSQEPLT
jgi:DNA modification methylase